MSSGDEPNRGAPADTENRIALAGRLLGTVHLRRSPAGIPIARFTLEHSSAQQEVGRVRQQSFRVGVRATGEELCKQLCRLSPGDVVRVFGYLARSEQATDDYRLLICARTLAVFADCEDPIGA
jgi:primosomal replication protein N